MTLLSAVVAAFWIWMVFDFFNRRAFEEDFWTLIVFFTPFGALIYFFGHYLPIAKFESQGMKNQRRFKALQALPLLELTGDNLRELGDLYRNRRKWADAVQCYERSLKYLPDLQSMRLDMARCLMELARQEDAAPFLREVVQKAPHYREAAVVLLSECLAHNGDWKGALTELEVLGPHIKSPEAMYQHAVCLLKNDQKDDARSVLRALLAKAPFIHREERFWLRRGKKLLQSLK